MSHYSTPFLAVTPLVGSSGQHPQSPRRSLGESLSQSQTTVISPVTRSARRMPRRGIVYDPKLRSQHDPQSSEHLKRTEETMKRLIKTAGERQRRHKMVELPKSSRRDSSISRRSVFSSTPKSVSAMKPPKKEGGGTRSVQRPVPTLKLTDQQIQQISHTVFATGDTPKSSIFSSGRPKTAPAPVSSADSLSLSGLNVGDGDGEDDPRAAPAVKPALTRRPKTTQSGSARRKDPRRPTTAVRPLRLITPVSSRRDQDSARRPTTAVEAVASEEAQRFLRDVDWEMSELNDHLSSYLRMEGVQALSVIRRACAKQVTVPVDMVPQRDRDPVLTHLSLARLLTADDRAYVRDVKEAWDVLVSMALGDNNRTIRDHAGRVVVLLCCAYCPTHPNVGVATKMEMPSPSENNCSTADCDVIFSSSFTSVVLSMFFFPAMLNWIKRHDALDFVGLLDSLIRPDSRVDQSLRVVPSIVESTNRIRELRSVLWVLIGHVDDSSETSLLNPISPRPPSYAQIDPKQPQRSSRSEAQPGSTSRHLLAAVQFLLTLAPMTEVALVLGVEGADNDQPPVECDEQTEPQSIPRPVTTGSRSLSKPEKNERDGSASASTLTFDAVAPSSGLSPLGHGSGGPSVSPRPSRALSMHWVWQLVKSDTRVTSLVMNILSSLPPDIGTDADGAPSREEVLFVQAERLGSALGLRSVRLVTALLRRMGDGRSVMRAEAIVRLGRLQHLLGSRDIRVVRHIMKLVYIEWNDAVRYEACRTLRALGVAESAAHSILVLTRDKESSIRTRTLLLLGQLGVVNSKILEAIILCLSSEPSPVTRGEAANALARLSPIMIESVVEGMGGAPSQSIQPQSGPQSDMEQMHDADDMRRLRHERRDLRASVTSAVKSLTNMVVGESGVRARGCAARALGFFAASFFASLDAARERARSASQAATVDELSMSRCLSEAVVDRCYSALHGAAANDRDSTVRAEAAAAVREYERQANYTTAGYRVSGRDDTVAYPQDEERFIEGKATQAREYGLPEPAFETKGDNGPTKEHVVSAEDLVHRIRKGSWMERSLACVSLGSCVSVDDAGARQTLLMRVGGDDNAFVRAHGLEGLICMGFPRALGRLSSLTDLEAVGGAQKKMAPLTIRSERSDSSSVVQPWLDHLNAIDASHLASCFGTLCSAASVSYAFLATACKGDGVFDSRTPLPRTVRLPSPVLYDMLIHFQRVWDAVVRDYGEQLEITLGQVRHSLKNDKEWSVRAEALRGLGCLTPPAVSVFGVQSLQGSYSSPQSAVECMGSLKDGLSGGRSGYLVPAEVVFSQLVERLVGKYRFILDYQTALTIQACVRVIETESDFSVKTRAAKMLRYVGFEYIRPSYFKEWVDYERKVSRHWEETRARKADDAGSNGKKKEEPQSSVPKEPVLAMSDAAEALATLLHETVDETRVEGLRALRARELISWFVSTRCSLRSMDDSTSHGTDPDHRIGPESFPTPAPPPSSSSAAVRLLELKTKVVAHCVALLDDPIPDVRAEAARFLRDSQSALRDRLAVMAMCEKLAKDRHEPVRVACAGALACLRFVAASMRAAAGPQHSSQDGESSDQPLNGQTGHFALDTAIDSLALALQDVSSGVRYAAARSLILLGTPSSQAIASVLDRIEDSSLWSEQVEGCDLLAYYAKRDVGSASTDQKAASRMALGTEHGTFGDEAEGGYRIIRTLANCLRSCNTTLREAAARSLIALGHRDIAVEVLVEELLGVAPHSEDDSDNVASVKAGGVVVKRQLASIQTVALLKLKDATVIDALTRVLLTCFIEAASLISAGSRLGAGKAASPNSSHVVSQQPAFGSALHSLEGRAHLHVVLSTWWSGRHPITGTPVTGMTVPLSQVSVENEAQRAPNGNYQGTSRKSAPGSITSSLLSPSVALLIGSQSEQSTTQTVGTPTNQAVGFDKIVPRNVHSHLGGNVGPSGATVKKLGKASDSSEHQKIDDDTSAYDPPGSQKSVQYGPVIDALWKTLKELHAVRQVSAALSRRLHVKPHQKRSKARQGAGPQANGSRRVKSSRLEADRDGIFRAAVVGAMAELAKRMQDEEHHVPNGQDQGSSAPAEKIGGVDNALLGMVNDYDMYPRVRSAAIRALGHLQSSHAAVVSTLMTMTLQSFVVPTSAGARGPSGPASAHGTAVMGQSAVPATVQSLYAASIEAQARSLMTAVGATQFFGQRLSAVCTPTVSIGLQSEAVLTLSQLAPLLPSTVHAVSLLLRAESPILRTAAIKAAFQVSFAFQKRENKTSVPDLSWLLARLIHLVSESIDDEAYEVRLAAVRHARAIGVPIWALVPALLRRIECSGLSRAALARQMGTDSLPTGDQSAGEEMEPTVRAAALHELQRLSPSMLKYPHMSRETHHDPGLFVAHLGKERCSLELRDGSERDDSVEVTPEWWFAYVGALISAVRQAILVNMIPVAAPSALVVGARGDAAPDRASPIGVVKGERPQTPRNRPDSPSVILSNSGSFQASQHSMVRTEAVLAVPSWWIVDTEGHVGAASVGNRDRAIQSLMDCLRDEHHQVRAASCYALGLFFDVKDDQRVDGIRPSDAVSSPVPNASQPQYHKPSLASMLCSGVPDFARLRSQSPFLRWVEILFRRGYHSHATPWPSDGQFTPDQFTSLLSTDWPLDGFNKHDSFVGRHSPQLDAAPDGLLHACVNGSEDHGSLSFRVSSILCKSVVRLLRDTVKGSMVDRRSLEYDPSRLADSASPRTVRFMETPRPQTARPIYAPSPLASSLRPRSALSRPDKHAKPSRVLVVSALLNRLQDWNDGVFSEAALVLGRLGMPVHRLTGSLIERLMDPNPSCRITALRAIGVLNDASLRLARPTMMSGGMVDFGDGRASDARCVLTADRKIDFQMVSAALRVLCHDRIPACREAAAETLGRIGIRQPSVVQGFVEALGHDSSSQVRLAVVHSIAVLQIREPSLIEALSSLLIDPDHDTRLGTVWTLARLCPIELVRARAEHAMRTEILPLE